MKRLGISGPQARSRRRLTVETLESRRLLVAEGTALPFTQAVDVTGLAGTVSAQIDWGDGNTTAGTLSGIGGNGNLRVRFDYRYDTTGFFNTSRRNLLQSAANTVVSRFTDDLSAIIPSGQNTWTARFDNPATGAEATLNNLRIAANEIVVFVGARNIPGAAIASGDRGGFRATGTSNAWLNTVRARGESGALSANPTDVGPWGGSITFDTTAAWHFGNTEQGLDNNEIDFVSVAMHELLHVLGFGSADSFDRLVTAAGFAGARARAIHGGTVPMNGPGHFADRVTSEGSMTLMSASIPTGTRAPLTPLDIAAMDDIGWTVADNQGAVSASHTYADNGQFPIQVILRGSQLGQKVYQRTATVTNVSPTLDIVGNQSVIVGEQLSLTNLGTITDPGFRNTNGSPPTDETFRYLVDWGDNSPPTQGDATIDQLGNATRLTQASFDGSHVYRSPGTYSVLVGISDDDGAGVQSTFRVTVASPPSLSLTLQQNQIVENDGVGATTLTVRRPASSSSTAVTVNLSSSDESEATLPSSVTLPAGRDSTVVNVRAIDDALLDGEQTVTVRATAAGYLEDTVDLIVQDAETLQASFNRSTIQEGSADALTLTLTRSNTDVDEALNVLMSGNNLSQLNLPNSLTLPPGQRSRIFSLSPNDDDVAELTKTVELTVFATGYAADSVQLEITDNEAPRFQNPNLRPDVDGQDGVTAFDALLVINALTRRGGEYSLDPESDPFTGRWYDVNGDYTVSALDALLVINRLNRLTTDATFARATAEATHNKSITLAAPQPSTSLEESESLLVDEVHRLF